MEIILFDGNLYYLVQVTKDMLEGIIIPKGSDCFDLCDIIRKNITFKQEFFGCMCR
jgi:hypothetical protein